MIGHFQQPNLVGYQWPPDNHQVLQYNFAMADWKLMLANLAGAALRSAIICGKLIVSSSIKFIA